MTADFIERHTMPDNSDQAYAAFVVWRTEALRVMRANGATFGRVSHPPTNPLVYYIEGWRARPGEQGPHPWEGGQ